jgi:hypothetical protein
LVVVELELEVQAVQLAGSVVVVFLEAETDELVELDQADQESSRL